MPRPLYTAVATASHAGRDGSARSSDGRLDVKLAVPSELGGAGGEGTNPEQLFAAGYAACFTSALNTVGRRERVSTEGASVTAHVGLIRVEGRRYGLVVELHVALPALAAEQAEALVAAAHRVCPYSNATRGNIPVETVVTAHRQAEAPTRG